MRLGLLTLVHQRHQWLPLIVEQVAKTWPGSVVHFTMDRTSGWVQRAVEQLVVTDLPVKVRAAISPFPALTHKEQFIELRDWQLQRMYEELDQPDWLAMWDDDLLFEDPEEAREAMEGRGLVPPDKAVDLLYATKRFLWETPDQENVGLPMHNSIQLFRNVPGQKWDKMVQAPSPLADTGRPGQLVGDMLDVGYLSAADRARVFKAYARTPKVTDPYTVAMVDPAPQLAPFKSESIWHKRIKEVYDLDK